MAIGCHQRRYRPLSHQPEMDFKFVLTNPFASCIYPILTCDETLSLLHEINASQPPKNRFPVEILLRINNEIHKNTLRDEIKSSWNQAPMHYASCSLWGIWGTYFADEATTSLAVLDSTTKTYSLKKYKGIDLFINSTQKMFDHFSSADLLYRLRCYFSDFIVNSAMDRCGIIWQLSLRHNDTGMIFIFSDLQGAGTLKVLYDKQSKYHHDLDFKTRAAIFKTFSVDALRLLNGLFGMIDGSRRFAFYHPAADADYSTAEERFVAVPYGPYHEHIAQEEDVYNVWTFTEVSSTDITNFCSILQDLKYDTQHRKIDRSNGTANLTTVISSSLLFYRLICKFMLGRRHLSINRTPPITSVWQVQLIYHATQDSIIFMDDRGLFDIRVDKKFRDQTTAMKDVDRLVEGLCSDFCTHPYNGLLAGCVA